MHRELLWVWSLWPGPDIGSSSRAVGGALPGEADEALSSAESVLPSLRRFAPTAVPSPAREEELWQVGSDTGATIRQGPQGDEPGHELIGASDGGRCHGMDRPSNRR